MKLLIRTIVMLIPMLILAIISVLCLVFAAIVDLIYWSFGKTNYWDCTNEWFQIKVGFEEWYRIWRQGYGDY